MFNYCTVYNSAMSTSRGPGQRAGLDRDQVLKAARGLLDSGGVEALSMRAVARALGVAPNALYSYLADKDELLDAVLDDILGEVKAPTPSQIAREPLEAVRSIMLASYEVLIAHPGLMSAYFDRQGARGVQAQRLGVVTLDALARAGLDQDQAREALRVLIVNTMGFAAMSARPNPSQPGIISTAELRRNFRNSLTWLLQGISS
jgi:TetR/AcrR family transcriptional regulator, tetracycline repressor protein